MRVQLLLPSFYPGLIGSRLFSRKSLDKICQLNAKIAAIVNNVTKFIMKCNSCDILDNFFLLFSKRLVTIRIDQVIAVQSTCFSFLIAQIKLISYEFGYLSPSLNYPFPPFFRHFQKTNEIFYYFHEGTTNFDKYV